MVLNETYLVFTGKGLREVKGKKINDDYAVTEYIDNTNNKRRMYSITHIKSGLSITKTPYTTIKNALAGFGNNLMEISKIPNIEERIETGIRQFEEMKEQGIYAND